MENLISREAFSGSLDRFQAIGIGDPLEPFSKIKVPAWSAKPQKANKRSDKFRAIAYSLVKVIRVAKTRPRLLLHVALLAAISLTVAFGGGGVPQSTASSLLANREGVGGVIDEAAAVNSVAEIASRTDLAISSDATSKASDLNAQVALPTSGDEYLAKRQVVSTAGAASRGISSYVVEKGDTLSTIAAKFNVTTNTIRWTNNIDGDAVRPGQTLQILPITGLIHIVAAGETAESIANKYQSNAAQIISFNNAEVKGLQVGQKIVVPDGVKQAAPARPASPTRPTGAPTLTRYAFSGNGYSYGQCTYYVAARRAVPSNWGNAVSWYYNAKFSGFSTGSTPVPGAIAWERSYTYSAGHVAYVESVNGNMVTVSEMNYWGSPGGGWNRVSRRTVPASTFYYIY